MSDIPEIILLSESEESEESREEADVKEGAEEEEEEKPRDVEVTPNNGVKREEDKRQSSGVPTHLDVGFEWKAKLVFMYRQNPEQVLKTLQGLVPFQEVANLRAVAAQNKELEATCERLELELKKCRETVRKHSHLNRVQEINDQCHWDEENKCVVIAPPYQREVAIDPKTNRVVNSSVDRKVFLKRKSCFTSTSTSSPQLTSDEGDFKEPDVIPLPVVKKKAIVRYFPPRGELVSKPLQEGDLVYACTDHASVNSVWKLARISKVLTNSYKSFYNVKFDDQYQPSLQLEAKALACPESPHVQLTFATRVVAKREEDHQLVTDCRLYAGFIAEPIKHMNNNRYLIFFDSGATAYVYWNEVYVIQDGLMTDAIPILDQAYAYFVKTYINTYPERSTLKFQVGQKVDVRYIDTWTKGRVLDLDASLVLLNFEHYNRKEWLYRGSIRFLSIYNNIKPHFSQSTPRQGKAIRRAYPRIMPIKPRSGSKHSVPFIEYTREGNDEDSDKKESEDDDVFDYEDLASARSPRTQTARKSTSRPPQSLGSGNHGLQTLRSGRLRLEYSQSVEVTKRPEPLRSPSPYVDHDCAPFCLEGIDESTSQFKDENMFAIPLILGWLREEVSAGNGRRYVFYVAPCGRRLKSMKQVTLFLRKTDSLLPIDLFTFDPDLETYRHSDPIKCYYYDPDLSRGQEKQPVSVINTVDLEEITGLEYCNVRFFNPEVARDFDDDFLPCCECTDNCRDARTCACQQFTIENIAAVPGLDRITRIRGYTDKRLETFILSGVFECNARCPCNSNCGNRVAQNGIRVRLQLFKTLKKGWGVRVLHDVPQGSFLCLYSAEILNDTLATEKGREAGDEYLADLDYIDICEGLKANYEEAPEESLSSGSDEYGPDTESSDCDSDEKTFPGSIHVESNQYRSTYNVRRSKRRFNQRRGQDKADSAGNGDEERRRERRQREEEEEERRRRRSEFMPIRQYFGEDFSYSLDAKFKGNIGRFFNHSCSPNVFVQNVFVDTHDLRFPWVAFFAAENIPAFSELTWDYNYEVGSIAGRCIPCYCGAENCKRRLL